jgi:hypothetical protein
MKGSDVTTLQLHHMKEFSFLVLDTFAFVRCCKMHLPFSAHEQSSVLRPVCVHLKTLLESNAVSACALRVLGLWSVLPPFLVPLVLRPSLYLF